MIPFILLKLFFNLFVSKAFIGFTHCSLY